MQDKICMQAGYHNLQTLSFYMHELVDKTASAKRFHSNALTAPYADLRLAVQALQAQFGLVSDLLMGKMREVGIMKQFPFRTFVAAEMERLCADVCCEMAEVKQDMDCLERRLTRRTLEVSNENRVILKRMVNIGVFSYLKLQLRSDLSDLTNTRVDKSQIQELSSIMPCMSQDASKKQKFLPRVNYIEKATPQRHRLLGSRPS
eukprot:jgi/Ulvmu1/217/UM001_0221.1